MQKRGPGLSRPAGRCWLGTDPHERMRRPFPHPPPGKPALSEKERLGGWPRWMVAQGWQSNNHALGSVALLGASRLTGVVRQEGTAQQQPKQRTTTNTAGEHAAIRSHRRQQVGRHVATELLVASDSTALERKNESTFCCCTLDHGLSKNMQPGMRASPQLTAVSGWGKPPSCSSWQGWHLTTYCCRSTAAAAAKRRLGRPRPQADCH